MPIYYVSKALMTLKHDKMTEKLVFALFVTTRKLKHYFQSFPIVRLTEYPLRTIVEKASGRIVKWVMEIRTLEVTFEPRTMIKGQILADYIVEFTPGSPP